MVETTTYTIDGKEFELKHHGVKGMRWGKRKIRKWATAKYQPSSAKSSYLAGLYAATRSERVGKALDKSNDRDAANWKRAKEEYKANPARYAKKKKAVGKKAVDRSLKKVGNNKVANAARTNQYLSGARAVQSLLSGNIAGAAYYGNRSSMYRDTKEYWK